MAALIRPTLLLQMDIDESLNTEDFVADLKRSYSYVSPPLVRSHSTGDHGVENIIRFSIKMAKPFWLSSEDESDKNWDEIMRPWLINMFTKVSNTALAYNEKRDDNEEEPFAFDWLELELGNTAIAVKVCADSSLPDATMELVSRVRDWINDATLTLEGDARIRIPSRTSIAQQDEMREEDSPVEYEFGTWGIEQNDGTVREFDSLEGMFKA